MKKLVGFFVLLIVAGGGWWYWVKYGTPPEQPTVNRATISRGPIVEAVTSTGALEPLRRYDIGSQVSGVVKAIYVDYNSVIKKGTLMAEIDPTLLQVQVDIQTANIDRQNSDINSAKVQLEDQKKQFERTKTMYEKGLQNKQTYDAAELAIKVREASIASSEKGLVSAWAQLESAKLSVSYCKIYAPADGVVVERKVDLGQTVQASMQSPSFFIMNTPLDRLRLTANVDEAQIGKIRQGQEVRFKVESYGQQQFTGAVEAVRLNATNSNGVVTYPVWITVPNDDLRLRPFMTASLSIVLSEVDDVVRVPMSATRFRPNAEIYTALGLTPPQTGGKITMPDAPPDTNNNARPTGAAGPGAGRHAGQNAQVGTSPAGRSGQNTQPGQGPGQTRQADHGQQDGGRTLQSAQNNAGNRGTGGDQQNGRTSRQPGQDGQTGEGAHSGRGFGQVMDTSPMTPEQLPDFSARFTNLGGGRGGQPGGGRVGNAQGGRGGGRKTGQLMPNASDADKIDELWAPIIPVDTRSQLWKWDGKNLTEVRVVLGVSDGLFWQLKSGELNVGDQVVVGVTLPAAARAITPAVNPVMGNQPHLGGAGGMGGGAAGHVGAGGHGGN